MMSSEKNGEPIPTGDLPLPRLKKNKKRAQNDKSTELRRSMRIWNKKIEKLTLVHDLSSLGLRRSLRIQNKNVELKPIQLEFEGLLKNKRARNKTSEESKPIFALEIFIEILSWLPLKSLSRAQLVCKEWREVIHDHYFLEKHMARSSVAHHWYNVVSKPTRSKPSQYSFTYIDGCDGLLLCRRCVSGKYYIFNPSIDRVLELPDPHDGSYGFNLVFVPSTKNYRVVSFYYVKASGRQGCEVLTPGPSMSWRTLTFPYIGKKEITFPYVGKKEKVSVVSAGGVVYCVLVTKVLDDTFAEVVTLDVATECLIVNRLPSGIFRDLKQVRGLNWDGKLGLADIVGPNMELMELDNYKKKRWSEKKMIPLPFLKDNVSMGTVVPLFNEHGDIWFCFENEKVCAYSIHTGEINDIEGAKNYYVGSGIYPYKPSLVSVEGMQHNTVLSPYSFKVSCLG